MKLSRYINLLKRLDDITEEVLMFETKIYNVRIGQLSGMPRGGSGDDISDKIFRLEELRKKRQNLIDEINRINEEKQITEREIKLIRYYYIDNLDWEDVAKKLDCKVRNAHMIRKKIIKKLE